MRMLAENDRWTNVILLLLLLLLVTACGRGQDRAPAAATSAAAAPKSTPPSDQDPPDDNCLRLMQAALQFGETETDIRARLGDPDSIVQRLPFGERRESGDSVVLLHYANLSLGLYRVLPERRDLLGFVRLRRPETPLPFGLRVGSSVSDVITALGPAREQPDSLGRSLEYHCQGAGGDDQVTFSVADGIVVQITWSIFID